MKRTFWVTVILLIASVCVFAGGSKEKVTSAETYKVFLITMDSMDQHWTNVNKGCEAAVKELSASGVNVKYAWTAPDTKDDAKQIEMINNAVANAADLILLAANSPTAANNALQEASKAGVQILYVDSPATYEPNIQTLCTNNEAAGELAGQTLLNALNKKSVTSGKIGVISVNASTNSVVLRDQGFRKAFAGSKFEILKTQYNEGDPAKAKDQASMFIVDGCVAVFGNHEGAAVGVGSAIKEAGSGVLGIGFDNSDNIRELVKDGYLIATMVQNPYKMGYEGMKNGLAALQGKTPTEKNVDTGVSIVTAADIK